MITTIYGANAFMRSRARSQFIDDHKKAAGDLGIEIINAEDVNFGELSDKIQSLPFLSSSRLVVVDELSRNKDAAAKVEELTKDVPESTELVIVESAIDKRSRYFKYLSKATKTIVCEDLDERGLIEFVSTYAESFSEQKNAIDRQTAEYLVSRIGLNQQLLSREVEKLVHYDVPITRESVELLTDEKPQDTIFQLLDNLSRGKQAETLKTYRRLRSTGVDPHYVISMLAWQMHNLLLIKTSGKDYRTVAKENGISPFALGKTERLARSRTLKELKSALEIIIGTDVKLKSTSVDVDGLLEATFLKLLQVFS